MYPKHQEQMNMAKSQNHVNQWNSDAEEYLWYDIIYIKFCDMKQYYIFFINIYVCSNSMKLKGIKNLR